MKYSILDIRSFLKAVFLFSLIFSANAEEAIDKLRAKADQGDSTAQFNLYLKLQPEDEAVEWLIKAAKQGHKEAQFSLGQCYWHGTFVEENGVEAVKWFIKAAEQGHTPAHLYVGNAYEEGFGVEKNDVFAYQWTSMAAANGDDEAQKKLRTMAAKLSGEQRAEGQRLATEWQAAFEKRKQQNQ